MASTPSRKGFGAKREPAGGRKRQFGSPNSFFRLGGVEILSMSQDERSKLWKIYLSTTEHYLISREFDRAVGMYANAPDEVVRHGLMEFSDTLLGGEFSMFKVMDMFIDRCFDEAAFGSYTENAVWMCIDCPTYGEVEDILNTYNCRLKWFTPSDADGGGMYDMLQKALFHTPTSGCRSDFVSELRDGFRRNGITSVFMNRDTMVERLLSDSGFSDFPVFMGQFSDGGEFLKFSYVRR